MICPKCGYEASGNFCNNCGAMLRQGRTPLEDGNFMREDPGTRGQGDAGDRSLAEHAGRSPEYENPPARRAVRPEERAVRPEQAPGPVRAPREKGTSRKKGKAQAAAHKRDVEKEVEREVGRRMDRIEKEEKREHARSRAEERGERGARWERPAGRMEGQTQEDTSGPSLSEAAVKGAVGMIVLSSRVMQLLSCALMACMVWVMTGAFLMGGDELGNIVTMVEENNYGLALYVGTAGASLFMGVVWCLWILSKKAAGGSVRLKKYDTGRGFLPFLICTAVIIAAGPAMALIPSEPQSLMGAGEGARAALSAINSHRETLLFCSGLGLALSLIRKILRV